MIHAQERFLAERSSRVPFLEEEIARLQRVRIALTKVFLAMADRNDIRPRDTQKGSIYSFFVYQKIALQDVLSQLEKVYEEYQETVGAGKTSKENMSLLRIQQGMVDMVEIATVERCNPRE